MVPARTIGDAALALCRCDRVLDIIISIIIILLARATI
jgi:hypothetical protein